MERQGLVCELQSKSKEQLCEILSRQEKLLNNKRFVQTLPDKGTKISEFVEKVRHALANKEEEEEEKKQASLASVRTQFQASYQRRQRDVSTDDRAARTRLMNTVPSHVVEATNRADGETSAESRCRENTDMREATPGDTGDLAAMFTRVTLSEENAVPPRDSTSYPFLGLHQEKKKPHYIEVLERSDDSVTKPRFKPSHLPVRSDSPSRGQSPGRVTPLLSAEARRQRDRKHLDDITAAKLPPLHHSPAQLLSLEESVTLLKEQTKKCQELQAKLAAQKLAEGLSVGVNSFSPEGGALAAYREVYDDGALSEGD